MGLSYMAEMKPEIATELLDQLCRADPPNAARIRRSVEEARVQYAERGFVSGFGVWYSYINAVGVAFRPTDGSPLVALTCGGIVDILPREKCLSEVGPVLVDLTRKLRARLAGEEKQPSTDAIKADWKTTAE